MTEESEFPDQTLYTINIKIFLFFFFYHWQRKTWFFIYYKIGGESIDKHDILIHRPQRWFI